MCRKKDNQQALDDFILPFGGALAADNRWMIKSRLIPWEEIEGDYTDLFPSGTENAPKPTRVAFGALVIKETLGLTNEETVEQIRENPYLQNFLGFKEYANEISFDPSLTVCFRQRFRTEQLNIINETLGEQNKKGDDEPPATDGDPDPASRQQARQDALDRNCTEGNFGEGKRRYGLNLMKTNLAGKQRNSNHHEPDRDEPGPLVPVSFLKERFLHFQSDIIAEKEPALGCCGLVYFKKGNVQGTLNNLGEVNLLGRD